MEDTEHSDWKYKSLEEIVKAWEDPAIKIISFDVFDTLMVRPLGRPEDLFRLLDRYFRELSSGQISFQKLRTEAEGVLRRQIIDGSMKGEDVREDVSLEDIYKVLSEDFGLSPDTASAMMEHEWQTELRLSAQRKSGAFLFEKALETGKPVIAISDMYLSEAQVRTLLEKNGYNGFARIFVSSSVGKRKITGHLYDYVVREMAAAPEEIFHIGDNEEADCRIPGILGFHTAWLPKAMDVYESLGCSHQAEKICADLTDWEAAKSSVGIGSMRAMAAEQYFDNPFRSFEKESDYNGDPYFVGYGALGMELLALTQWLAKNIRRDQVDNMIFMARDGYLPMKAYELYRELHPELPPGSYLPISRIAVLPMMFAAVEDLWDFPADLSYQTPGKLLGLLGFCSKAHPLDIAGSFPLDTPFTKASYHEFIRFFIKNCYDKEKHEEARRHIGDYLRNNPGAPVTEKSALFDMGYSGRIASAVIQATGLLPKVYYFHADAREHFRYERCCGMEIRTFFDFNPYMEASIREYSYLEPAPSCVAYTKDLRPVYDVGPAEGYKETVTAMQKGALDFVRDFLSCFGEFENEAGFRGHEGAMPFEAFIRFCSPYDRRMYEHVLIDDELWGGRRNINLKDLMETRLRKIPDYAKEK